MEKIAGIAYLVGPEFAHREGPGLLQQGVVGSKAFRSDARASIRKDVRSRAGKSNRHCPERDSFEHRRDQNTL